MPNRKEKKGVEVKREETRAGEKRLRKKARRL